MGEQRSNDGGWSGDVPVTPPPIQFVFGDVVHHVESSQPHVHAEETVTKTARETVPTPVGPWLVPLAVTVGLIGAAIAVAALRGGPIDESTTDLSSESSPPTTSVASTTAPTTDAPSPSTTTQSATTVPVAEGLPAAWRTETITLPERVRAMTTPTRIFALTGSGVLYDIDVQAGTMQSLDLDTTLFSSRLLVAGSSVLITNNSGSSPPVLVPDGGQPIEFPLVSTSGDTYIQGVASNGVDYVGESWNGQDGRSTRVFLRVDGTVDEAEDTNSGWRPAGGYVTGEELIVDAGGLYLESSDGTVRRISDGVPVATSAASVLTRECDEQRQCGYVIIDLVDGTRVAATVPDGISFDDGQFWNPLLAPDGHAVLISSHLLSGVSALFVDLLDGTTTPVSVNVNEEYDSSRGKWASDSSGVFTTDQGDILFVDQATGEVTAVPLGDDADVTIVDVAVRQTT